jgi:hypothetical protein
MMKGDRLLALAAASALALLTSIGVAANVPLTRLCTDPYTNSTSQHATEVEPDTFSFGNTIVFTFQQGVFIDGGSSNVGWATSSDGGSTGTCGSLPGTTVYANPPGPFARDTDSSVAYDPKHGVWIIAQLPLNVGSTGVVGAGVIVSRSTNGGTIWGNPVTVVAPSSSINSEKPWIVCDTWAGSLFYGTCYIVWDNHAAGDLIEINTSTDGGLTWSPQATAQGVDGIGVQPVVQPNGTVIVAFDNPTETAVGAFTSTNGGGSWGNVVTISTISSHTEAGGLRSSPLPTAEVDGAGRVFVAWQDCRFERGCKANDIVYTTSTNGVNWTSIARVPSDPVGSGVDHFIPGLAVNKATSGGSAHLALYYYFYPVSSCTSSTCQLDVGFSSSSNGGASWTAGLMQAGPMNLSWLASTTQGVMVGDYISASYNSSGLSHGAFAVAFAPTGGVFDEAIYTNANGQAASATIAADVASAPSSRAAWARTANGTLWR